MIGHNGEPPCATTGIDFTADNLSDRDAARAVDVCLECPVMVQCLEYLRKVEVAGIAGGMTVAEREEWRARQGLERSPNPLPVWATTPIAELTPADVEGLTVRVPTAAVTTVPLPRPTGDFVLLLLRMRLDAGWKPKRIAQFFADEALPHHVVADLIWKYVTRGSDDYSEPSATEMPWDAIPVEDLTSDDVAGLQFFDPNAPARRAPTRNGKFTPDFIELVRRMTDEGWTAQEIADWFPDQASAESVDYLRREVIKGSKITAIRKARHQRAMADAA